jgi:ubiquinone/menaquinone biosynthesis C-methylase UbiE
MPAEAIPHRDGASGHTGTMTIWFGAHMPDDRDLNVVGDLTGRRVVELGVAPASNAVSMAAAGARAIAVDPSAERIAAARTAAEKAETTIQAHHGDLADLGFVTSASVDLVVAAHTLGDVEDLPRLLRQVHRVLKPGAAFLVARTHPVAAMFDTEGNLAHPYADSGGFAAMWVALERSNFRIDRILELADVRERHPKYPTVLLMRARKEGV